MISTGKSESYQSIFVEEMKRMSMDGWLDSANGTRTIYIESTILLFMTMKGAFLVLKI